jgi:hypothetical protein
VDGVGAVARNAQGAEVEVQGRLLHLVGVAAGGPFRSGPERMSGVLGQKLGRRYEAVGPDHHVQQSPLRATSSTLTRSSPHQQLGPARTVQDQREPPAPSRLRHLNSGRGPRPRSGPSAHPPLSSNAKRPIAEGATAYIPAHCTMRRAPCGRRARSSTSPSRPARLIPLYAAVARKQRPPRRHPTRRLRWSAGSCRWAGESPSSGSSLRSRGGLGHRGDVVRRRRRPRRRSACRPSCCGDRGCRWPW